MDQATDEETSPRASSRFNHVVEANRFECVYSYVEKYAEFKNQSLKQSAGTQSRFAQRNTPGGASSKIRLTSSPKGNDAHLRAIIQSEKKWKNTFFGRLRAASSVVLGRIWLNFKLIQALMYVIITCKYEKDPIKNNREKVATLFLNYNTICCHGNQW